MSGAQLERRSAAIPASIVVALLGAATVCWFAAARRMSGMDMGPGGALGSLGFFTATWATMMAAMMLPSAVPAVLSFDRLRLGRVAAGLWSSLLFVASYLGVWTLVGIAAYGAYRAVDAAHLGFLAWDRGGRYVAAGAIAAAGLYDLTALKRTCLRRCRAGADRATTPLQAGLRYAGNCVGCSAGLMVVLFAVGVMSFLWMALVTLLVFAQKVPRQGARLVVPVALLLVGLSVWIALAPGSVPGLTLPM
jgi:predicted metal-binding membrane protein